MSLSKFPAIMPLAASACIEAANALRFIRDNSGDLTFQNISRMHAALAEAKLTTLQALQEGAKQPVASETFMQNLGGPQTLVDFQGAAVNIESQVALMNARLQTVLDSLTSDELIGIETRGVAPTDYREVAFKSFIPAAKADSFRTSTELADLISAFEAVGAV